MAVARRLARPLVKASACLLTVGFLIAALPAAAPPRLVYAPSQPVGNLDGDFAVDGNGSATYSLAIQVPPGTGGVAPGLAVTYNSQRGNGYLGMGWALSGVSAITRCGANYRQDGFKAGVAYDDRDRFCLDDRRLMAVSGTYGANGTVYHTEPETWTIVISHGTCGVGPCSFTATDKDGHALSFGGTTGPTGSRIPAQGRSDGSVRTWSLDAQSDLNGNAATITYATNAATGEYYPTRFDYTSNAAAGLAAQRSVRLAYTPRPDLLTQYLGGSQVQISQLLTEISTHVTVGGLDERILTYRLAYQPSAATGRSRLQSITLCDGSGVCWPATTMAWSTASGQWLPAATQLPGPVYVILDRQLFVYGVLMDFNGDGIADYSQAAEFVGGTPPRLTVYLGQPDGSFRQAAFSLPGPLYRVTSTAVVQVGLLQDINGDGVLDYSHALRNEDSGSSDLTVYLGTGSGFIVQPSYQLPAQVFWQVNGRTLVSGVLSDLNGDGIPDYSRATRLLATGEQFLDIYRGTGTGFVATGTRLPGPLFGIASTGGVDLGVLRDVNGDGIADFSAATVNANTGSSDLKVFLGRSPDFTFVSSYDLPDRMLWVIGSQVLESGALVDVNGDGIPDYSRATLIADTGQRLLAVQLGTAKGFSSPAFDLPGPLYSIVGGQSFIQGMLSDWNGDGTTRYSRATQFLDRSSDLALYRSGAGGFVDTGIDLPKAIFNVLPAGTYANAIYQDVNGDGITDFVDGVCALSGDGTLNDCSLGVQLAAGPFSDLLQNVTDGFRGSTTVAYAPITGSVYRQGGPSSYPIRTTESPLVVVSGFQNADGRGNSYSYSYSYSGAQTDALGYGWLGFQTVTMTEQASGRSSQTTYGQGFPFYGLTVRSAALDAGGALLAATDTPYVDIASPAFQQLGIHQPVPSGSTFTMYTAGQADYALRKELTYDGYGNLAITADLGDPTLPDEDVYTCTRYSNEPARGRFGYPLQSKTERTLAGCQAFVRAPDPGSIVWDPSVDLLWSKTTYDDRMNVVAESRYDDSNGGFLTNSYTVDAFGNTATATSAAGATTTFTYDADYRSFLVSTLSPPLTRDGRDYRLTTLTTFEPGFGMLIATTDPNGNVSQQEVDGFGRVVEVSEPSDDGASTVVATSQWMTAGGAYFLESRQRPAWTVDDRAAWYWQRDYYDGLGRQYRSERDGVKEGQPATVATDTTFDADGRVFRVTTPYYVGDPAPATTRLYDAYNRPTRSTDPAGVVTALDYAQGGLKTTRTNAFGTAEAQTEVYYLNPGGSVREAVSPNGLTTVYTYSKLGQVLTSRTSPDERLTTIAYDSLQRARVATSSDTGTSTWTYDPQGFLTATRDGAGNTVAYSGYDPLGRLGVRTQTFAGGTTTAAFSYDDPVVANGQGNLTGVQMIAAPLGTWSYVYGYTAGGQVKAGAATLAGDEYVYASTYDPLGRVVEATHPDGSIVGATFLTASSLASVSFRPSGQGAARTFMTYSDYTALDQVQKIAYDVPGIVVQNSYYPIGPSFSQLRTSAATKGESTLDSRGFTWNPLYWLTGVQNLLDPAASETFGYRDQPLNDGEGFLTSAAGPYGTQGFDYDRLGNVTRNPLGSIAYETRTDLPASTSAGATFSYFANGNLQTRSDAAAAWSYTYDADGLLVQVDKTPPAGATQTGRAAYDADGRQVFFQRVGEALKTYRVTPSYEVVDLGTGTFQHTAYVAGLAGTSAAVTGPGKGNAPTAATQRARAALYGARTAAGSLRAAGYHGLAFVEQLRERLPLALAALLGVALLGFAWLSRSPARAARGCSLRLAGRGAFTAAVASAVVLCLLVQPVAPARAALVPGPNGAGIPSPGTSFFLPNHLQSTFLVADANGTVTARLGYEPYGAIDQAHSTGTDDFRPKFVGREWDPTTSLYDLDARQYSPDLGRFLTADPAGQFTSPYLYAGSNPVSAIDPNGELAFLVALVIGVVVGAYLGAAAVNHDSNPAHWNWSSGKTYTGLAVGAVIGAVGAAAGGVAVEAGVALGASGGLGAQAAGVAVGIAGQALVGAGENAAFAALGGGSGKEIGDAAAEGALWGAAFAVAGEAIGGAAARLARRGEAALDAGEAATVRTADDFDGAASACASFTAGTPVMGADGRVRPIESIRAGDEVASGDPASSASPSARVGATLSRLTDDLVSITLDGGQTVTTTPEHPFRAYQRGWVLAKDLDAGDLLEGLGRKPVAVAAVERKSPPAPERVYNFTVEERQTYRVGDDGVLVHNPKAAVCRAVYDRPTGTVTRYWSKSELQRKFPTPAEYQAVERDIRMKMRRSNQLIKDGIVAPRTRVSNPVRMASKEWIRWKWKQVYGAAAEPPARTREAAEILRPHFTKQDVDEFIERIMGGLTIKQGYPQAQGVMNYYVNQVSGAAIGAMSRSVKEPGVVRFIRDVILPSL